MLKLRGDFNYQENAIAFFAYSRGGSTWFSSLIAKSLEAGKVDEPLYRGTFLPFGSPRNSNGKLKDLDDLDFYFYQPIPEAENWKEVNVFFEKLLGLRYPAPYIFEEMDLWKIRSKEKFLFKFCHGNMLLPWFSKQVDLPIIFLIRNPYSVVSSQLNHFAFDPLKKLDSYQIPLIKFHEEIEPYRQAIRELKYPEEVLTLFWCMNHKPIIEHELNNKAWHTVSYEKLVLDPQKQLAQTANYLEQKMGEGHYFEKLLKAYNSLPISDPSKRIFGWKKSLTKQNIDRIEKVLNHFEVNYFNKDGEIDYSKILNKAKDSI